MSGPPPGVQMRIEAAPVRRNDPATRPLILGHRGASAEAPENTRAAFDLALRQGADGIECDVRISSDGIPVVIHDARLERTTSGRGRVGAMTAAELQRLDASSWFYRRGLSPARAGSRDAKIPLLAEVMNWVREHGCLAYVEIKRGREVAPQLEERILEVVDAAGVRRQVTLISFHLQTLVRLRALDGEIALGLDCTRPLLAIRRATSVRAAVILPLAGLASRRFIARAHAAGLRVAPWGAETPRAWRRMVTAGADALIGNRPALMRRAAGAAPKWRAAEGAR